MLPKNVAKLKRKERKTWVGYAPKATPTKKEKLEKINKKYKKRKEEEQ